MYFFGNNCFHADDFKQETLKNALQENVSLFWEQLFLRMQNDFTPETKAKNLPKRSITHSILIYTAHVSTHRDCGRAFAADPPWPAI